MSRFDRYMLSQLLVLFGFFALILVAVYWVNRAVVLFDQLIADGQSAGVFLEFTLLSLPRVIRLVLPMSAFAAAVYVTNRLSRESELVVMQATGFSPWRLSRPVIYFGLIVAVMMGVLTHYLVPLAQEELDRREAEIQQNATARLLTEGTFLHPAPGVTFYIREITPEGALKDVFLSDRRQPDRTVTYTAAQAFLVNDENGPKLVMVEGLSQFHSAENDQLITTNFSDFAYSIAALLTPAELNDRKLRHVLTSELIRSPEAIAEEVDQPVAEIVAELHYRLNRPVLVLLAALVGFSTLLVGGYSRFGVWRQIVVAFVLLIVIDMLKSTSVDQAGRNVALWPIVYAPTIFGTVLITGLLAAAARPGLFSLGARRRRRAAA